MVRSSKTHHPTVHDVYIVMAMILILGLKAKSCAAAESCREKGEEVEERNTVL
jgi:hypothetical protein